MNTPQHLYRFVSEMGDLLGLATSSIDPSLETANEWQVALFQSRSHRDAERPALRFSVTTTGNEDLCLIGCKSNGESSEPVLFPIKAPVDSVKLISSNAQRAHWCANPSCMANLSDAHSVIRTYINKDGNDPCEAEGHYHALEGDFESDAFPGFDGDRYDLLDDSDRCAACDTPI